METVEQLQKELDDIRAVIPEGYIIAKDTLAESVALMVAGLRAYSKDRQELFTEFRQKIEQKDDIICDLQKELIKLGCKEDDIP